jgi:hypothetical protein
MIEFAGDRSKIWSREDVRTKAYTLNPQFISNNFKRLLHSDGSARNIT